MSETWTAERILALAPDASSAKSGRDLANPRKWQKLGHDERSAWGLCQGSGANPYQTQIDLSEPAFKCSCPSRKFPCKHGLGLFLLLAGSASAFGEKTRPQWVDEWISKRAQRTEEKTKKREDAAAQPVDAEAAAKRLAQREKKVGSGLKEIELWLHDLVRQGLATVQTKPYSFWETAAARMVDAQCPGVARLVRNMGAAASSGSGWDQRLLRDMARLNLIVEGYKRIESLPAETQADLRALIGFTVDQDRLLSQSGVRDRWFVAGQRVDLEDRLRVQRTWLLGQSTSQTALLLQFAHGTMAFPTQAMPGTLIDAEMVFYPSALPMRALIKTRHEAPKTVEGVAGYESIGSAAGSYANALARFPWLETFGAALNAVTPQRDGERWWVADNAGDAWAISPRFARPWHLAAASGGRPIWIFGEFDGDQFIPLSMIAQDAGAARFSSVVSNGEEK